MKIADKIKSFRANQAPRSETPKKASTQRPDESRKAYSVTLSAQAQASPVRFGTYNVAGGNKEKRRNTADEISPYAAHQITRGEVDVLALQ